ncbi:hypothetical protein CHL72_12205 [Streptococcus pneumoniae]|nr:hypothetical protein CHL72_12205 [Streptococcus pneumoniae]
MYERPWRACRSSMWRIRAAILGISAQVTHIADVHAAGSAERGIAAPASDPANRAIVVGASSE